MGTSKRFYEGGIREPFLVRWPGVIKPGSRCDVPIHQIDLFPTLAATAGTGTPDLLDGLDLRPAFEGGILPDRPLFWHFPAYLQGYGKDRGSPFSHFRTTPCSVVRRGDWKLIEYFEDGALELYNLRGDPGEQRNAAADQPARRDELHAALRDWRQAVKAPVPTLRNPQYRN